MAINWKDRHDYNLSDPKLTATHNDKVDIAAPGYDLAVLYGGDSYKIKWASGTSFAAPEVAGTAALVLSVNGRIPPADVERILKCAATDINELYDNYPYIGKTGAGRLDAAAALQLARDWPASIAGSQINARINQIRWSGRNGFSGPFTLLTQNDAVAWDELKLEAVGEGATINDCKWIISRGTDPCTQNANIIKYGNPVFLVKNRDYPGAQCGLLAAVKPGGCNTTNYYTETNKLSICPCYKETTGQALSTQNGYTKSTGVNTDANRETGKRLLVIPNPAVNRIYLNRQPGYLNGRLVLVRDIAGRLVLETRFKAAADGIDCSHLTNGIYVLKLMSGGGLESARFVISGH
jgi:hypothetical protein